MSSRALNYRQCQIIARLGLAPAAALPDATLRALIGPYATNVIQSLVDRGVIEPVDDDRAGWTLTLNGRDTTAELLGPTVAYGWKP